MRIELGNDFVGQLADFRAARHAAPGRVHAVHDVVRRGFTVEQLKRFGSRTATAAKIIEALRLVHRAAAAGQFVEGNPQHRIVAADFHANVVPRLAPPPRPFTEMRLGCHGGK